jgi:hypothetical protein
MLDQSFAAAFALRLDAVDPSKRIQALNSEQGSVGRGSG